MITFDPDALTARRDELEQGLAAPGFWDDQQHAAEVSAEHARISRKIESSITRRTWDRTARCKVRKS